MKMDTAILEKGLPKYLEYWFTSPPLLISSISPCLSFPIFKMGLAQFALSQPRWSEVVEQVF